MIILGIDPGSRRVGYGIIQRVSGKATMLAAGILPVQSSIESGALLEIVAGLNKLIVEFKPEVVALERLFFSKNQKTGMQVAQARGAILTALATHGLKIEEYSPNEIKMSLTGYGLADKRAVLKIVRIILNEPELKVLDDASDALALALIARGVDRL